MIAVAIMIIPVLSQIVTAVTLSACGNLTSANTVYDLTGPITSSGTCLTIKANNITINCHGKHINYMQSSAGYGVNSTNFDFTTVKGCMFSDGISPSSDRYAVYYYKSRNGTIFNNTMKASFANSFGIILSSGSVYNNVLRNNITISVQACRGIDLVSSNFNNIANNTVKTSDQNSPGIELSSSNSNILSNNTVMTVSTTSYGIYLYLSSKNTLIGNKANSSISIGYLVQGTASSDFNNSIDGSNKADGRPVNYTYNKKGLVFNNLDFTKYGQVIFAWCRNITIRNSNFSRDSLNLFNTKNSSILGNKVNTSSSSGIFLNYFSDNNTIKNNIIVTSTPAHGWGISLFQGSRYNLVSNNTISTSSGASYGIYLVSSDHNIINNNSIKTLVGNSAHGIYVLSSNFNALNGNAINILGISSYGIFVDRSGNNSLGKNTVKTSAYEGYGIALQSAPNTTLTSNKANTSSALSYMLFMYNSPNYNALIDSSNFAEGKPVNYTYNKNNLVFNNVDFTKYGQVTFYLCRNITITNSNFSRDSLSLFGTKNSLISGNRINTSTGYGIYLSLNSTSNSLKNNRIMTYTADRGHGIYLGTNSDKNNMTNNSIMTKGTNSYGIYLQSSLNGNRLSNNIINTSISSFGIFLFQGPINTVIDNNTVTALNQGIYLFTGASRNRISNNKILVLLGSAAIAGIFLNDNCANNIIANNTITSFEDYGIRLYSNSNNNIFSNNNILTSSANGYGIIISSSTNNNTFSNMYIRAKGSNAVAIGLDVSSNSFTISDSILNASNSGVFELNIASGATGGVWNFTNVTRPNKNPIRVNWASGSNGRLNMHWYLDVSVKNSTGLLKNANVTSYSNQHLPAFSELTSAQGKINRKTLLQYSTVGPKANNYTRYSPYNLTISLPGYPIYYNNSINLSNNKYIDLNLACFCPIGQDWPVRDICSFSGLKCNMPNNRVTCSNYGKISLKSNSRIVADKFITPIGHSCISTDGTSKFAIIY